MDFSSSIRVITSTLSSCFTHVSTWCAAERLLLKTGKTEVMWFGTTTGPHKLPARSKCIYAGVEIVKHVSIVKDLAELINAEQCATTYSGLVSPGFFIVAGAGRSANFMGKTSRFNSCVLLWSRGFDYCNGVLAGLVAATLAPLQRRVVHGSILCDPTQRYPSIDRPNPNPWQLQKSRPYPTQSKFVPRHFCVNWVIKYIQCWTAWSCMQLNLRWAI